MTQFVPDVELIKKYNKQGPRYTSYPTALKFTEDVDRTALRQDIQQSAAPISLYFHVPFCENLCWFCGCNTLITRDHTKADTYLDYLEKELDLIDPLLDDSRRVVQMHFGGGTPNFLDAKQLNRLGAAIERRFEFEEDSENSVELDPRNLTRDHVKTLRSIGMSRASFGVQDCNLVVQEAINRIQPHEMNLESMGWLREEGFTSVNVDLMYGLPHQTVDSFEKTLDLALELDPDRFAVFSYAHVPWMKPSQKLLEKEGLPSAAVKLQLLKRTIEKLTSAGYSYIGLDHFAKANDELVVAKNNKTLQRNFQGYSTRGGTEILAFGVSSISQSNRAYRQNYKTIPQYYEAIDQQELPIERGYILNDDDQIRRQTIMRLMCDCELDFEAMSKRLGISFQDYFSEELRGFDEMIQDDLLTIDPKKLTVSPMGQLLIRNIAMHFDAYQNADESRYSRTV